MPMIFFFFYTLKNCFHKFLFFLQVESLNQQLEMEKQKLAASTQKSSTSSEEKSNNSKPWSPDDLQLLVKGVNLFPAGTNNRYIIKL